jgi:G3E family GTPase
VRQVVESHAHSHGAAECTDPTHDHGGSTAGGVHSDAVTSVSIVCPGLLDLDRINDWLGLLLDMKSDDIYRMKGVLAIEGAEERFVFQGVHALFEGSPERLWRDDEEKVSRMVFIGKDLPKKEDMQMAFETCLVENIKKKKAEDEAKAKAKA